MSTERIASDASETERLNIYVRDKVERKIFSVQSTLLNCRCKEQFEQAFAEAKLWLQPRHYAEIVEERSMEGICGFPACQEQIKQPSTSSSQLSLRISYKEKRLYEIDGSVKYCGCECLKSSASYELSLEDTSPFSRVVAQELVRDDGNDSTSNAGRRTAPPSFYHAALDPAGAAKSTGDTISAMTSALKSFQDTDRKTLPNKGPAKGEPRMAALSVKATHFLSSTVGSPPILNYQLQTGSHGTSTAVASPSSNGSAPRKPKSVGFASDDSDRDVREAANAIQDSSTAGKGVLHTMLTAVTETGASPQSHSTNPGGAVDSEVASKGLHPGVGTSHHRSPAPSLLSPMIVRPTNTNIPTSATVLEHESRIVKKMNFDAEASVTSVAVVDKVDAVNGELLLESQVDDISHLDVKGDADEGAWTDDDTAVLTDRQEVSLFMLLWTVLDDFFGNEKVGSYMLSNSAVSTDLAGDGSKDSTAIANDRILSAKQRSTAIFIEKGFSKAEGTIKLPTFLSGSSYATYVIIKRQILACVDLETTCPPLSSGEWALLALVLIDAIVCGKNLLPDNDRAALQEWNREVEKSVGVILRIDGGRHRLKQKQLNSSQSLRDGDLALLRSFFPRLMT